MVLSCCWCGPIIAPSRVPGFVITLTFRVIRRCIIDQAGEESTSTTAPPISSNAPLIGSRLTWSCYDNYLSYLESTLHNSNDFAYQLSTPPHPPSTGSFYKGDVNYRTCHNKDLCFLKLSYRGCKTQNCLKSLFELLTVFLYVRRFCISSSIDTPSVARRSHVEMPIIERFSPTFWQRKMALKAHKWEGTLQNLVSHLPNQPITGSDSDEARQWIDVHHVYCSAKSVWLPRASTSSVLFLANLEKSSPGRCCPTQYNLASAERWQLKLAALNELSASKRKRWARL